MSGAIRGHAFDLNGGCACKTIIKARLLEKLTRKLSRINKFGWDSMNVL